MARRRTYDITEEQYLKAINWLEEGGTKKGACDILKVSNNKTMENLINEFTEKKVRDRELRAKKRKLPVLNDEVVEIITEYLNGFSLSELSDRYYRSVDVIKYHLNKHGALLRQQEVIDPSDPPLIPDECVAESFEVGQYVWSAKYGSIAKVTKQFNEETYRILALGEGTREYAYQHVSQLGSLKHLEALGVKPTALVGFDMTDDDITMALNRAVIEGNKRK